MIFEKILSTINKYNLIQTGDKIVLGLSGGPDSVCLLHILNRLKRSFRYRSICRSLKSSNKRYRSSKRCFICFRSYATSLGITYFIKSINVPEYCKDNKLSLEEGARKLRYEMFYEIKEKLKCK